MGMMFTSPEINELWIVSLKLMLETYFDLAICTFINVLAFSECQSLSEFLEFFSTVSDFTCSTITIVMLVAIVALPIWIYRLISKNKEVIHIHELQDKHGWLFEELRVDT
jgi:hypothetical protein